MRRCGAKHLGRVKDQPRPIRQGSSEARQLGDNSVKDQVRPRNSGQLVRGRRQGQMEPGGVSHPARHPGQTQTRPDPCQAGLARHGPRAAWLRGPALKAALNAQTEGCVPRRDLRLTTVRQGEQGRRGGHVAGLRPSDHGVCSHRCTGSIRVPESSPALGCCSATVTPAIS